MKKIELASEFVRFNKKINSLDFFNELTIKCVVGFGGFVKILEDPWQLMVRCGPF